MGKGIIGTYIDRIDKSLKDNDGQAEQRLLVQEIVDCLNGTVPGIAANLTCYRDKSKIIGSYANGLMFPESDLKVLRTRLELYREQHATDIAHGLASIVGTFFGSAGKELMEK